jgi:hypothetical protein
MSVKFSRVWAMPSKNTFSIKPVHEFINRYNDKNLGSFLSIDPFANSSKLAKITNDLDPKFNCDYTLDALDFLKLFLDNSVDLVLFDPPFSPRQVSECYKRLGKTVNMQTTQASFWSKLKDEIARIVKPNGYALCFGWNSNGIGKTRGFELEEVLLIPSGSNHNDLICTAERKLIIDQMELL